MPKPKNTYMHMYLVALEPEAPLPLGVILQALVKSSGDTVGAVSIRLDDFELWRNQKLVKSFKTIREMFAYITQRGW